MEDVHSTVGHSRSLRVPTLRIPPWASSAGSLAKVLVSYIRGKVSLLIRSWSEVKTQANKQKTQDLCLRSGVENS